MLVFLGALILYLMLPSTAPNADGLRVFPSLHEVEIGADGGRTYSAQPWSAGYQEPYYYRANVQKHVLFPLYAWFAYRAGAKDGRSVGLRPLQTANALAAALTVGLIMFLIAWRPNPESGIKAQTNNQVPNNQGPSNQGPRNRSNASCALGTTGASAGSNSLWPAILAGLGLVFSSAFSSQATDIPEVVPALPWLAVALLLMAAGTSQQAAGRRLQAASCKPAGGLELEACGLRLRRGAVLFVAAGIALGLSTAFYFAGAVIGAALSILVLVQRRPRDAAFMFAAMVISALLIYSGILLAAGYGDIHLLVNKMTFMPVHGSYGQLRPTNALAVLPGFAGSLFPVLPDDFGGLRQLLAGMRSASVDRYLGLAAVPVILALALVFAAALVRTRRRLTPTSRQLVGLGLTVFLGALASSLLWDPYHLKLWVYSNVGLWLMVGGFAMSVPRRVVSATLALALAVLVGTNLALLIRRHSPNPKWAVAENVSREVAANPRSLIVGGWEPEFGYLSLLLPDSGLLTLPDLVLESRRARSMFEQGLDERIEAVTARGGQVYFLNLFGMTAGQLRMQYGRSLEYERIQTWLDRLRARSEPVLQDCRTGVALHRLVRASPGAGE